MCMAKCMQKERETQEIILSIHQYKGMQWHTNFRETWLAAPLLNTQDLGLCSCNQLTWSTHQHLAVKDTLTNCVLEVTNMRTSIIMWEYQSETILNSVWLQKISPSRVGLVLHGFATFQYITCLYWVGKVTCAKIMLWKGNGNLCHYPKVTSIIPIFTYSGINLRLNSHKDSLMDISHST